LLAAPGSREGVWAAAPAVRLEATVMEFVR
jgi:hypothetical protein